MLLRKTHQQDSVKGIYMPKEKRIEARNEIAKAHFHFGDKSESKFSFISIRFRISLEIVLS